MLPQRIIIIVSHLPIGVAALYALVVYRQLSPALRTFSWFLFISAIIQFASLYCWFHSINNMPLLHLYVITGFISLAAFYNAVLQSLIHPRIIGVCTLLFVVFSLVNSIFFQKITSFNSYALTAESVLLLIFSLFTYRVLLTDLVKQRAYEHISSLHWINSGIFIYHSSTLIIFFLSDTIINTLSVKFNLDTWVIHSFFSVVMYSCFFIGLWKRAKQ